MTRPTPVLSKTVSVAWSGLTAPTGFGGPQITGMTLVGVGAVVVLWCALTFALIGKGTPAPFDPPRRLVDRGPYRFVRNPMYLGAALALTGAAVYYQSLIVLSYAGVFLLTTHLFVVSYEEPTLRRTFGEDYGTYCSRVGRWWPRSTP